ncbi:MAG: aspartate-semialdehyde dehydrogenase [Epsilonproteobacteria bacterium]|nr:MAG: aspartate-semialdehyde dehydrogenase [Campylobacterota bacterium]RLA67180.1 MAG: aspartate-semialdehyde dehydrogenase [Campylobacterota bacterium]
MMKLGIIGWRGMVGSVLLDRLKTCGDLERFNTTLFSSTQKGLGPLGELKDSFDLKSLSSMDIIISCQGSDYTQNIHPRLRQIGWSGYWIDASSFLRDKSNVLITLDPVNQKDIESALENNQKDFVGGNCTVSLMLMALGGLFSKNLVEWVNCVTYQAASGAGAAQLKELFSQISYLKEMDLAQDILKLEKTVNDKLSRSDFPSKSLQHPLIGNLLPWIDSEMENGMSKEEWKGEFETNKILGKKIPIESLCVRVGAFRCHSQALTVKLKEDISLKQFEELVDSHNQWVKVIPNNKADSLKYLTPVAVSGSLSIPVGRIRKLSLGPGFFSLFTVGDQLLWGAAEPLRRMAQIILNHTEQKQDLRRDYELSRSP